MAAKRAAPAKSAAGAKFLNIFCAKITKIRGKTFRARNFEHFLRQNYENLRESISRLWREKIFGIFSQK